MPNEKLMRNTLDQLIEKFETHISGNKEDFNEETKDGLLHGKNGLDEVKSYISNLKEKMEPMFSTDKPVQEPELDELKKDYDDFIKKFNAFKNMYAEKSDSKELMSWFEVFDTRIKDDRNVLKQVNLEEDRHLGLNAIHDKYTQYPNGYGYNDRINKIMRVEKRAGQYGALGNSLGEKSALKRLSDKINEMKESNTLLDKEETKNLINIYADAAVEIKQSADAAKDDVNKVEFYRRMMKKFSKDYTALHTYKNSLDKQAEPKLKTITQFYDDSRTRTVSLPETEMTEIPKSGAGQSIRYKIDVKCFDEPVDGVRKGDIFTGYFTADVRNKSTKKHKFVEDEDEAKCLISEDAHKGIIDYLSQKYPGARDFIQNDLANNADVHAYKSISNIASYLRTKSNDFIANHSIETGVASLLSFYNNCDYASDSGVETLKSIDTHEKYCAYVEYASLYQKQHLSEGINRNIKIDSASAQGQRNALTSSLADILGCGDIVAFAEKMKVEALENGKKVTKTGVLMMPAKGIDNNTADCKSPFVEMNQFATEGQTGLMKSVGTLQLLDYIIGNVDRHAGNFFYQFDENGKMIGVQGIDNDTICGANPNLDRQSSAVAFENFRMIPKSVADSVKNLKPEVFEVLMQGYDLNPKEIETAVNRFKDLKVKIKESEKAYEGTEPGFLDPKIPRIVPDNEMDKYSFNEQLAYMEQPRNNHGNLFGKIANKTLDCTKRIKSTISNDFKECSDLAADIAIARTEAGPGSLINELKRFNTIAKKDKNFKKNKKNGSARALINNTISLFDDTYRDVELVFVKKDKNNIQIHEKGQGYDFFKGMLEKSLDSANAYLLNNSDKVLDYQTLKAEVDYYKAEGNKEELIKAERELKKLEKTDDVKLYKSAVRIRDKVTEQLSKMQKIEKTVKDMEEGSRIYDSYKNQREAKNAEYLNSQYRADTLKRISEINGRNRINKVDIQKNAEVNKTDARTM